MRQDKINLALLWPKYGNATTSLNDLVLGLDKDRFNVIFIYLSGHGVGENLLQEQGYKVFYLSNIRLINAFRLSILFKLVKILKQHKVDILHCHRHKPSFYGTLAGVFAKTPVVLSHVHGFDRTRNLGRKFLNFLVFRKVRKIIGCSQRVRDDVLRNNPSVCFEKVIALENSVDFKKFADEPITKGDARRRLGLPCDSIVFGTVGRLAPTKGHLYLVQAFAQVKRELPDARLLIVGCGQLESELQTEADKTTFGESIHFLGRRDDVQQILKALDVFVFPSVAEGFGLALAEAMAVGLPCIATEVGGIPEVTNGPEAGILVRPGDAAELARVMISTARMPSNEIAKVAENAQNRVRRFYSHEVVGQKLANLYEDEFAASSRIRTSGLESRSKD